MVRQRDFHILLGRAEGPLVVKMEQSDGPAVFLLAPASFDIGAAAHWARSRRQLAERVRIAAPRSLRKAVIERASDALDRRAVSMLSERFPIHSSRTIGCGWQNRLLGATLVGLPAAAYLVPLAAGLFIHAFFSVSFLACVGLRLVAAMTATPPRIAPLRRFSPSQMPVYSVLVPLYREAEIIPDLLVALGRIVWPRGKLEIKLVCEADDRETLEALRVHRLQPFVEIVEVPAGLPRTKPKALAYALPMTAGEFVVLYDAEDRPHPLQLVEAWQRFRAENDEMLACLQAPLVILNGDRGMLPRMFAFEYAALFRGLLPWLSRHRTIVPLGGTSNHFRRSALEAVGGWDPFNVTEDADLGARLARFGYRVSTISRPTYEDAPETLANWLGQRTRWFKGWLETWLVHMRQPVRLSRELGAASFLLAQILFVGMVMSSLAYPVFLASFFYISAELASIHSIGMARSVILVIDIANICLGYVTFLVLGRRTLLPHERPTFWITVLLTPFYWCLLSLAAWRSLWKLYREPHFWEKTHHPRRDHAARAASAP
jgi:cellulose synthase/poly-beta-1,6-N-acetylglucosamine synthase-like glycosyltransferase